MELVGRTFDLSAAYKHYGVHSSDRSLLRLTVRDPHSHTIRYFGVNSLPFGASGSVGPFLRISLGFWWIGLRLFRLAWTAYFDDFTPFCTEALCQNTTKTECLYTLLGVDFARDGDKAQEFAQKFRSLGMEINMERFSKGVVNVGHTSDRQSELKSVLEDILAQGILSAKQAESLRGRMDWFESFAFGRIANGAVKVLGNLASRYEKKIVLGAAKRKNLEFLMHRVSNSERLIVTRSILQAWVVFTDGAVEGPDDLTVGSVGRVLFSPSGACWNSLEVLFLKI